MKQEMEKWGQELKIDSEEGGWNRRRRSKKGKIIPRLFDKASRTHVIFYLPKIIHNKYKHMHIYIMCVCVYSYKTQCFLMTKMSLVL